MERSQRNCRLAGARPSLRDVLRYVRLLRCYRYIPGSNSPMVIRPVVREMVKREGFLPLNANAYVKKLVEAVCRANCFRMRQSSLGPFIVRSMYYAGFSRVCVNVISRLTRVITVSGISFCRISSITSFFTFQYSILFTYSFV